LNPKKKAAFPKKVLAAFSFDVFAPAKTGTESDLVLLFPPNWSSAVQYLQKQGQDETSYSPFTRLRRQQRRSNSGKRKDRRVPGKPKTDIVVSVILIVPVAIRDPAVVGIVVPGPATNHADA